MTPPRGALDHSPRFHLLGTGTAESNPFTENGHLHLWTTLRRSTEPGAEPLGRAVAAHNPCGNWPMTYEPCAETRGHLEPRSLENGMQEPSSRKPVDRFQRPARQTRTDQRSPGQSDVRAAWTKEQRRDSSQQRPRPCSRRAVQSFFTGSRRPATRAARAGGRRPPTLLSTAPLSAAPGSSARKGQQACRQSPGSNPTSPSSSTRPHHDATSAAPRTRHTRPATQPSRNPR